MNIWAIIPVKPFNRAKSRLAQVLSAEQRVALSEKMFLHSLALLSTSKHIGGVLVISRDTKVLGLARDYNVHTVQESGTPELNAALLRASQIVGLRGAEGVLIVPADLPLISAEDIEQVLHLGRYNTTVVLAPDRNEDGTNLMLITPPGYIPFSYGTGSFHRHIALADEAKATVKIYHSERVGLDIDTPADLALYQQITGESIMIEG